MVFINLFLAFLRIGLFAIGGAYSFLPLLEKEIVQRYHWLSREEFMDISGMAQIFPGAISIKYATYTGYKIGGVAGAILANFGNILAPVLLMIFASVAYLRYSESAVLKKSFEAVRLSIFAMIIAVAFQATDIHRLIQIKSLLIIILSFLTFIYTRIHPSLVIILAGIIGAIWR